jgi:predicted alpha/beta-fold hydrolase
LRNAIVAPGAIASAVESRRLLLPLADGSGDRLAALLQSHQHGDSGDAPLLALVHGLGGNEDSTYIHNSAAHALSVGYRVLRLNLRGAGPSRSHCRFQYHAGRAEDLRDALRAVDSTELRAGLFLVGYSLGANMLLKFLALHAAEFPIRAAAAVSAPLDLAAASRRFLHPRNRIYHWSLLRSMKAEALEEGAELTAGEAERIRAARTIYDFDQTVVAPRNGYADAEEYYADNMSRQFLARIRIPTLIVHALDDPWIPPSSYTTYPWGRNPQLLPLLSPGGGHVGFHGADSPTPWHDRCITTFFADRH